MKYIFGYGSLMNPKSLEKTLPHATIKTQVSLRGFRRIFNAPVGKYLYLNIRKDAKTKVRGVLIPVDRRSLFLLKKREVGYRCVDISRWIEPEQRGDILAFIAPGKTYPQCFKILRSYMETCLLGVRKRERVQWLQETIIQNPIFDDRKNVKYKNVAFVDRK